VITPVITLSGPTTATSGTFERAITEATSSTVAFGATTGSSGRLRGSSSATVRSPSPSKIRSAAFSSTTRASAGSSWQYAGSASRRTCVPASTVSGRPLPSTTTSPADVAHAILDGVEAGDEDIFPDPMSRDGHKAWRDDPKALERQMASI
jgi:hypothetical protein